MKGTGFSKLAERTAEPSISWLMRLTLDHPKLISLAAGFTDGESLPVDRTAHLIDQILSSPRSGRNALQYGSTSGDPELRRLTAHDLGLMDGDPDPRVHAADRVIITNG